MKKFGTPIGAGPGIAKLNVGFEAVGTPPGPRCGAGRDGPGVENFGDLPTARVEPLELLPALLPERGATAFGLTREEGCCVLPRRAGDGADAE
jgi:hypothetical protein